jgi:replicative DNA helicase
MTAASHQEPPHPVIAEWLRELYGTAEAGWLTIFSQGTDGNRNTDWAPAVDTDTLAVAADRRAPTSDVWFGVAIRKERLDGGRRGGATDCLAIPGLWLDIDIEGPGHKGGHQLARDRPAAHALVDTFPLRPTAVIDSGGGLQAWWLFDELHDIETTTPDLLAAWGATWTRLGSVAGIHVDNVFDVARIMRLPGTTNRKEGLARSVQLISAEWGQRYGVDDLEQHLDEPPAPPERSVASSVPYIGPERPGDAYSARHTGGDALAATGRMTLGRRDHNGNETWIRDGRDPKTDASATVYADDGHTTFWSETCSQWWPAVKVRRPYDPFGLYAAIFHNGDHTAASAELRAKGYGEPVADVRDLIAPRLLEQRTVTVDEPWPEPRGLPEPPRPPAFPIGVLPDWAQDHAHAVAEQIQIPVDLAAMLIIGALSAATTGRANVHVSPNWVEPVNLYLVTAMRSGAGKSPADKLTVRWLRTWQSKRIQMCKADHDRAQLKVKHARKKLAKLEGTQSDERDLFAALDEVAAAEADVPPLPRLLADDATPEAVAGLLRAHDQRLAILSTEADLFDMLLRGKPGQRANMNIYLKAWSGDSFTRDRKGSQEAGPEWAELDHPLLTVACTVQPSVLAKVQADDEMMSRGFAARFMFSIPEDMIGRRDQTKRFSRTELTTTHTYEAAATALADRWATWGNPANLHFSHQAADLLEAFLTEIEPRLAADADLERLGEWANKLHGSIARYAGLLHLAEHRDAGAHVEADIVARAIELGRYWLANAISVLALEIERTGEQAQAILDWACGEGATFTPAQLQAKVRKPGIGLDKVTDYVPALELLVELGWIRPVEPGDWRARIGVRRAKSPDFALWPDAIGRPQRVSYPRSPRTASMGESNSLSSSPCTPTDPPSTITHPPTSGHPAHRRPRPHRLDGPMTRAPAAQNQANARGERPSPSGLHDQTRFRVGPACAGCRPRGSSSPATRAILRWARTSGARPSKRAGVSDPRGVPDGRVGPQRGARPLGWRG